MGETELENRQKKEMYVLYDAYDDSAEDIWGVFDSIVELKKYLWNNALENASIFSVEDYLNNWTIVRCELNHTLTEDEREKNHWRNEDIFSRKEVDELKEILKSKKAEGKIWRLLK